MKSAYNKALSYLTRREYSRRELELKLLDKGFVDVEIDEALTQLIDENYLSDERFAEAFVKSRANRGYGPVKIRLELSERAVANDLIEANIESMDWMVCACRVQNKHFKQNTRNNCYIIFNQ